MTTFYSDVKPLPKYSPVTLHLSPATRILSQNPAMGKKLQIQLWKPLFPAFPSKLTLRIVVVFLS